SSSCTSLGRLSTSPSAPSPPCSSSSTTVRSKLGSANRGVATSSRPRNEGTSPKMPRRGPEQGRGGASARRLVVLGGGGGAGGAGKQARFARRGREVDRRPRGRRRPVVLGRGRRLGHEGGEQLRVRRPARGRGRHGLLGGAGCALRRARLGLGARGRLA